MLSINISKGLAFQLRISPHKCIKRQDHRWSNPVYKMKIRCAHKERAENESWSLSTLYMFVTRWLVNPSIRQGLVSVLMSLCSNSPIFQKVYMKVIVRIRAR